MTDQAGTYELQLLTAGLYQKVMGIIAQLDQTVLRDDATDISEIAGMLSEKGLLVQFLSIILDIDEDQAAELDALKAVGFCTHFFTKNGGCMIASGTISSQAYLRLEEAVEEIQKKQKQQDPGSLDQEDLPRDQSE